MKSLRQGTEGDGGRTPQVEAELTETLAKREVSGRKFKELVNSHAHRGL
jgi:hypothetical protein